MNHLSILLREEINLWWKQALKDLEAAEINLRNKIYYVAAFLSQQAVEKALKALFIKKLKKSPGSTHSLIYLGKEVNIPDNLIENLRKLTPDFVISRYPDITQTLPYELYDEKTAKEKIELAREVLKWIEKQLKS